MQDRVWEVSQRLETAVWRGQDWEQQKNGKMEDMEQMRDSLGKVREQAEEGGERGVGELQNRVERRNKNKKKNKTRMRMRTQNGIKMRKMPSQNSRMSDMVTAWS